MESVKDISEEDFLNLLIPSNCVYDRILNVIDHKLIHNKTGDSMVYTQHLKKFTPIEQTKLTHMFNYILTNIKDDNDRLIPSIDIYLKPETNCKYVDAVDFVPPPAVNNNDPKIFNLFDGFEVEKK